MKPTLADTPSGSWSARALRWLREQALLLLLVALAVVVALVLLYRPDMTLTLIACLFALVVLLTTLFHLRGTTRRLRDVQRQTQTILDAAADGILTLDERGLVRSFNVAAGRLFGRTAGEVIGQHVSVLIPDLDAGALGPGASRWEGGPGGRREMGGRRADGTRLALETSVSAGEIDGRRAWVVIVRDKSAIKRNEEALERERNLLARLMDHVPDRIYFKDQHSRFIRVNRALGEQFGLADPAGAIGKTDFDFFSAEHAEPAFRDEQEVMRTGAPIVGIEEKETWPDGRVGWVSTTKLPLRDAEGCIVGTFGISRDVTARKLAEMELQKAKEAAEENAAWARLVVDTAYDAFIVMDERGVIVDWNLQAEAIFGRPRGEALGKVLADVIIPHEYRDAHTQGLARFLRTGEGPVLGKRLELPALDRHGRTFPVEITIRPLRRGRSFVFSAFLHDVSARKQAEAELQKATAAAESANRAKSEFLANMSHEIRTPMNGIIGMTELALGTNLTPEQNEYLQMVKTSAESLLTIINDVLDFSKIEARKLHLEKVTFNLRDAVGDTVRALAIRAQQKGLELVCHVRPGVPEYVVGDPGRLRQVLVNLIGNALKFTSAGEVVLHVAVDPEAVRELEGEAPAEPLARRNAGSAGASPSSAGSETGSAGASPSRNAAFPDSLPAKEKEGQSAVHFEIRDTGIGIPADKLDSIFQPFEQADHSTTRRYGGTGLGLAIATQLVELMGGRLAVRSEVGKGSTFSFTATFAVSTEPPPTQAPRPVHLTDLRVLCVDDNATNRRLLEEILHSWAMRPVSCASADAAMEELRRASASGEPYPLVLLDAHMPDVDGFMLAERIQRDPSLSGAVLVMLTSAGRPDDVAKCRELNINAYLLKPVKQSDLLATLLTALDGSRRLAAPPTREAGQDSGRPLRILLAEDNAVNQKLATRLLEKQGHVVTVVGNGRAAVEAVAGRERFDVVLMDVQMPELDGFEATALIRQQEKTTGRAVPIVAMTAHAMKGDRERCLEAGMDAYVAKPIQARELIEVITGLLARQKGES